MTVVINRPCHDCTHRAVCRIRDVLEATLAGEFVSERAWDPALELAVTVDISCAHHVADIEAAAPASPQADPDADDAAAMVPAGEVAPPYPQNDSGGAVGIVAAPVVDDVSGHASSHSESMPATTPASPAPRTATRSKADGLAPLFPRQAAIVAAIRAANGNQIAAADALGRTVQTVYGTVSKLRQTGALPADIDQLIDAHKARGTKPRSTAITPVVAARLDADEAIARAVAARSRELAAQDARPADAHDEFVATRIANARARVEANQRRLRGEP